MENTNARYIKQLPEPVNLVTIDASFISLKILLPVVKNWFAANENLQRKVVALIEPQFEAGRKEVAKGKGVVRSPELHFTVLKDTLEFAQENGYEILGLIQSPLIGPKGNKEFLAHMLLSNTPNSDLLQLISSVVPPPLNE